VNRGKILGPEKSTHSCFFKKKWKRKNFILLFDLCVCVRVSVRAQRLCVLREREFVCVCVALSALSLKELFFFLCFFFPPLSFFSWRERLAPAVWNRADRIWIIEAEREGEGVDGRERTSKK